jgi:recombination protein RecA
MAKAVDQLGSYLKKQFAESVIDPQTAIMEDIKVCPTGWFELDYGILGIGGFPRGRVVEVFGPEMAGKSLIAMRCVAQAQKLDPKLQVVWFDTEQVLNDQLGLQWAQRHGIDISRLHVVDDVGAEKVLHSLRDCCEKGAGIIVVDSLANLIPEKEWEERDKHPLALLARVISSALKQVVKAARLSNTLIILVNQVRDKPMQPGMPTRSVFGSVQTPGGRALKHLASVRLHVEMRQKIYENDHDIGNEVGLNLIKSKVSPRGRRTGRDAEELKLYLDGRQEDQLPYIIRAAERLGLVERSGAWFTWKDHRGQGLDKLARLLRKENVAEEFEHLVTTALREEIDSQPLAVIEARLEDDEEELGEAESDEQL